MRNLSSCIKCSGRNAYANTDSASITDTGVDPYNGTNPDSDSDSDFKRNDRDTDPYNGTNTNAKTAAR